MIRRNFLRSTGLLSGLLTLNMAPSGVQMKKEPCNLLVIMTDQQRWDALSLAGNKILKTPNLDRLAQEGAYFENAYTACAVCGPARASILTGCSVENTKVITNEISYEPESLGHMPMKTYDELLAENGYITEYYGKWHTPLFRARVYKNKVTVAGRHETEFGPGMKKHFVDYLAENVKKRKLQKGEQTDTYSVRPYVPDPLDKRYGMEPTFKIKGPEGEMVKVIQPDLHGCLQVPAEHSITALQAKDTINALERLKDGPLFSLTCSFHYPHAPMVPTEPYYSMYPPEKIPAPQSIDDPMDNSPYEGENGRLDLPEYRDKEKIKYMISNYYGLVKEIDDWIGKILQKLKDLGLEEKTMVVFISDHGEMLGSHGMREKNVFYEESAHIPLMIKLPGAIEPGTVVKEPVSLINLFATILDYSGMEKEKSDGKSLRGLIEGKDKDDFEYVVTEWDYHEEGEPKYMVRAGDWKYITTYHPEAQVIDCLYNLEDDPYEINNLIGLNPKASKYESKVKEMKKKLISWLENTGSKRIKNIKKRPLLMKYDLEELFGEKKEN